MKAKSIGEEVREIIETVPGGKMQIDLHLLARSAGRFIEEGVELAIAFGLKPAAIMGHVMDALHNEAMKQRVYPSELVTSTNRVDAVEELADATIQIDHLRVIRGIKQQEVGDAVSAKITKLWHAALSGNLKIIDGLMYRKDSRP